MKHNIKEVLKKVDELNELCTALRKAYLKSHPDAPLTAQEIERKKLLEYYLSQQIP